MIGAPCGPLLVYVACLNRLLYGGPSMKALLTLCLLLVLVAASQAQQDGLPLLGTYVKVVKQDGSEYLGKLVSQDDREVRLDSTPIGSVVIPRYLVATIKGGYTSLAAITASDERQDRFSTRYFLTTNGFSNSEDGSYILFNIFGPDFQFALSKHVTAGVLTTWIGAPIVGSLKYSSSISENVHGAVGVLAGSGVWLSSDLYFALPYASVTYGTRLSNINVSVGYGLVAFDADPDARALLSVAGTTPIWGRLAFVFDSMILPEVSDTRGTLMFASPGIRWFASSSTAFQVGYPFYIVRNGNLNESGAVPFPTFGLFVKM